MPSQIDGVFVDIDGVDVDLYANFREKFSETLLNFQSPLFSNNVQSMVGRLDPSSLKGVSLQAYAAEDMTRAFLKVVQGGIFEQLKFAGDMASVKVRELVPDPLSSAIGGLYQNASDVVAIIRDGGDKFDIGIALAEKGIDTVLSLIQAAPVVGQIADAILGVVKFVKRIVDAVRLNKENEKVYAPWRATDKDRDKAEEFIVRNFIRNMMGSVDWTSTFLPPFNPTSSNPFRLMETAGGPPGGAQLGVFETSGTIRPPAWNGNLGFIPGTQQMSDVTQISLGAKDGKGHRSQDVIMNLGKFYPTPSQFLTSAWQQANVFGSPDLYKINVSTLRRQWETFFYDMYDRAHFESFNAKGSKAFIAHKWVEGISPYVGFSSPQDPTIRLGADHIASVPDFYKNFWGEKNGSPTISEKHYKFGNPMGNTIYDAYKMIVEPMLDILEQRQRKCLQRTVVSAYVDPARYGAFIGADAQTQSLRESLNHYRSILLNHDAIYNVWYNRADRIDPQFAAQMEAQIPEQVKYQWKRGFLKKTIASEPTDVFSGSQIGVAESVPNKGGTGYAPVEMHFNADLVGKKKGSAMPLILAAGVVALLAARKK